MLYENANFKYGDIDVRVQFKKRVDRLSRKNKI